jgi:hypothetical protein
LRTYGRSLFTDRPLEIIAGCLLYLGFHFGAGLTHHRYQQLAPPQARNVGSGYSHRKLNVWASLGRGPYVNMWGSIPLPGGFRLGHNLLRGW